ncbi:MAG: hypothetical protein AAF662_10090 [Pseudomonadota bacterium]
MSNQIGMPVELTSADIARKRSFGASLILCAETAGYELDKQLQQALDVDKAQFSRWKRDGEGIQWSKLQQLMDLCGNHAPVLWMLHQLGYDIDSLRKRETELETKLRIREEENAALKTKLAHLEEFVGMRSSSAV